MDKETARSLIRRVENLEKAVHKLSGKQYGASVEPKSASDNKGDPAGREIFFPAQIDPPPPTTHKPDKPWYKTFNGWKTRFEIIAIFAGVWYAWVTYQSWRDLRHNFQTDQRAWLTVKQKEKPPMIVDIGRVPEVAVTISNTGKTAAVHILGDLYIEVVKNGDIPHFESLTARSRLTMGLMTPSETYDVPVTRGSGTGTATQDFPLTQAEKELLRDGGAWVAVHGMIAYDDVFKTRHWLRFCMWSSFKEGVTYKAQVCTVYNSLGDY